MLFNTVLKPTFAGEELVYSMRPAHEHIRRHALSSRWIFGDAVEKPAGSVLDAIRKRGVLRVGVLADRLPFVFVNRDGKLVGFDVEMAQHLARDLGVRVEFVEIEDLAALPRLLASGRIDLAMTGMVVTPERAGEMLFSEPYLDETLAFVVKDQLREEFSSWANIRDLGAFPVTIPDSPYYIDQVKSARAGTEAPIGGDDQADRGRIETGNIRRRGPARRARIGADFALPEIHGCRAGTGDRQDTAGLSRGQARSRVGAIRQYLDRAEAERRHHRRALRPLDSGEARRQAPAALVGYP